MISADVPQLNELRMLVRNVTGLTGKSFKIPMTAMDFSKKTYIKETGFPSYAFVTKEVLTGTEAAVFPLVGLPKRELRDVKTAVPWK